MFRAGLVMVRVIWNTAQKISGTLVACYFATCNVSADIKSAKPSAEFICSHAHTLALCIYCACACECLAAPSRPSPVSRLFHAVCTSS